MIIRATKNASISHFGRPQSNVVRGVSFRFFSSAEPTREQSISCMDKSVYWKPISSNRFLRPIYIAATKQNVGKTTTSLAIVGGLQKMFDKVGFIKPVGQQHVPVHSNNLKETIRVDKDVLLIREFFSLQHIDYQHMSPVLIPRGYTKRYIDHIESDESQYELFLNAYQKVNKKSDIMVCEGTGHCAVGSVVNMNNAQVASMIGANMVLVANGGLGSTIDELELNRILCQYHGVNVAGVIINKVNPKKYDQTKKYLTKALAEMWGIPLLGCIPDRPFLGCPALADLERLFKTELICGKKFSMRHYDMHQTNLVTTNLRNFLLNLRTKPTRMMYFCHTTRDDIILGFLGEYQRCKKFNKEFESSLIICGREAKYTLSDEMKEMMIGAEVPIMHVRLPTAEALEKVKNFTPKLNIDDMHRVRKAVDHYEKFIDYELLLQSVTKQFLNGFNS